MPKAVANSSSVVDLDAEESLGMAGSIGKVVSIQKRQQGGTRRSYDDAVQCPHCQGRLHMNLAAATINFECLWRQFCLATNLMEKPDERLPVFTVAHIEPLNEWAAKRARSRSNPLGYGKMTADGSPPATYAGVKVASKSEDTEDTKKIVRKSAREAMQTAVAPAKSVKGTKTKSVAPVAALAAPAKPVKSGKSKGADFDFNNMELEDEAPAPRKRTTPPTGKPVKGTKTKVTGKFR